MTRAIVRDGIMLLALSIAAVLLHGYHYGIEDQTLYLPAIEKALNPALFPHDAVFFQTETRLLWFDDLMAWFVRGSHLRLDWAMFLGHIGALFLLLFGCLQLARRCFADRAAAWTGLVLLVIMTPFPVAGTRLGIMEQDLHPRGLAMAVVLLAFLAAMERRLMALFWIGLATAIHPLTGLWSIAHVAAQAGWRKWRATMVLVVMLAFTSCEPMRQPPESEIGYWRTALSASSFDVRYPINWPWWEWIGVVVPLALFAYFAWNGQKRGATRFAAVSRRLLLSGTFGVILALVLTSAPDRRFPFQPMRELHLVYIVMMLFLGARAEQRLLRGHMWRRLLLFVPVVAVVLIAQRHFPSSPRIEWPGRAARNAWVAAFEWAGQHTDPDALFALDPFYLRRSGPDSHSFRAIAERSMLAEAVHDIAPAAMSPALSARWMEELRDQEGWPHFTVEDFRRLKRKYGVSWVIVNAPGVPGLACPYSNDAAAVCRVE